MFFSIPFLVPSGNNAIHFPSFKSFNDFLIADTSFSSLFTGIASNAHPKNAKNLFLYNSSFAKIVAENTGIDEYKAELLPQEKFRELNDLQQHHQVIFVGDGINDAPSLVQADVGISMGSIGSNSAIEASDIVIMNDDLESIPTMLYIANKTKKIILMNLIFSIGIKILILLLAMFGIAHMAAAVFADTGVTLLAILNSLRILKD